MYGRGDANIHNGIMVLLGIGHRHHGVILTQNHNNLGLGLDYQVIREGRGTNESRISDRKFVYDVSRTILLRRMSTVNGYRDCSSLRTIRLPKRI